MSEQNDRKAVMTLRIAFTTDIHLGPDIGAKKGTQVGPLLERFIDAAHEFQADYIVTGGDDISSRDPDTDKKNIQILRRHFQRAACPVIRVEGNHCGRFKLQQNPSQVIDTGTHQIFIWNPYLNRYSGAGVVPDPQDITWLEISLAAAARPVILFTHIPPKGPPMLANVKPRPAKDVYYPARLANEKEIQDVIEASGKVISVHSGHRHRNYRDQSGNVHYLTQQSMAEDVDKSGKACGAYTLMEFTDDLLSIHGFGTRQPAHRNIPLAKPFRLVIA